MVLLNRQTKPGKIEAVAEALITGGDAEIEAYVSAFTAQRDYVESYDPIAASQTSAAIVNDVAYVAHVRTSYEITVSTITISNATAAGNVDVGIYTSDDGGTTLTRLASSGPTAATGNNALQDFALSSSVTLEPGTDYYLAGAVSAGHTMIRTSGTQAQMSFKNRVMNKSGLTAGTLPASLSSLSPTSTALWMAAW